VILEIGLHKTGGWSILIKYMGRWNWDDR